MFPKRSRTKRRSASHRMLYTPWYNPRSIISTDTKTKLRTVPPPLPPESAPVTHLHPQVFLRLLFLLLIPPSFETLSSLIVSPLIRRKLASPRGLSPPLLFPSPTIPSPPPFVQFQKRRRRRRQQPHSPCFPTARPVLTQPREGGSGERRTKEETFQLFLLTDTSAGPLPTFPLSPR